MDWTRARAWRESIDGPVVFTNGVFDLLHPGHVELLEAARREGAALVVGVNSDASARRLAKGPGRPVAGQDARARVVAGLAAVDCVVLFEEETPLELIRALAPDVLVKGADYPRDRIVGAFARSATEMPRYNPNYVGGDIASGANDPVQMLSRPRIALDPYSTGIPGVYICSASTPPGGGVHGMGGHNAALSALRRLQR